MILSMSPGLKVRALDIRETNCIQDNQATIQYLQYQQYNIYNTISTIQYQQYNINNTISTIQYLQYLRPAGFNVPWPECANSGYQGNKLQSRQQQQNIYNIRLITIL